MSRESLSPTLSIPRFTRALSPDPRDGYIPHLSPITGQHDGMWQESDEMFRQRIMKSLKEETKP